jgi:hypothetical protein
MNEYSYPRLEASRLEWKGTQIEYPSSSLSASHRFLRDDFARSPLQSWM